jgi:hypothetical protein
MSSQYYSDSDHNKSDKKKPDIEKLSEEVSRTDEQIRKIEINYQITSLILYYLLFIVVALLMKTGKVKSVAIHLF